jgi:hypothetical protein
MDAQMMPVLIGVILLFVVIGQLNSPEFDMNEKLYQFIGTLAFATLAVIYGYVMHLIAMSYPESPFNKHTSPVFMVLLCAGICIFCAWQFYQAGILLGLIIYSVLSIVVVIASICVSIISKNKRRDQDE